MDRRTWLVGFAPLAIALAVAGCSKGDSTTANGSASAAEQGPDVTVYKFLEAVRTGVDTVASEMLTPLARQKTAEKGRQVAPPGSDTASFTVDEVDIVDPTEAHVASTWTDLGDDGQPHTDEIVWFVRQTPEGWRIQGMATAPFPELPPLILNFEDPDDMDRKEMAYEAEIVRRQQAAAATAQNPAPGTQTK